MPNGDEGTTELNEEERVLDDNLQDEISLEDEEETPAEASDEEPEDEEPEAAPQQEVVLRVEQERSSRGRKSRRRASTMKESGYDEIDQLIQELDPGATTRVYMTITRIDPKVWKGRKIEGYLDKIDRHVDIQEMKDLYGGGTFDIKFFGPRKFKDGSIKGNKIITSRRIVIAGDPIIQTYKQDEDEGRQTSAQDPDIVKLAFGAQEKATARMDAKNREDKETMLALINSAKGGGNEETVTMMMKMLEVSERRAEAASKTADAQIAAIREEAKLAREEAARKDEKHKEELRELRREMDEKKSQTGDTMINFMREQSNENMKRMELTMKSMSDNSKVMMEMMSGNHKAQAELLTGELKRVSDELKDARLSNKGDLVSEMKKVATLQGFIKDIAGVGQEEKSLTDKLTDNLPEIMEQVPGIIAGIGSLFRGQRPVQTPPQQMQAGAVPRRMLQAPPRPLPPRRPAQPPQPSSFPSGQAVEDEAPVPVQHQHAMDHPQQAAMPPQPAVPQGMSQEQQQQMEIAQEINKLKVAFEDSLEKGVPAEACYKSHVEGQYDEELLRKIAVMPTPAIIAVLQQNLDDDSPLFTVKGKDFLRHMHNVIREKYA
jgi:hypothetical protein